MSITDVTKKQLRDSILAIWSAERPDADSTKGSDLWLYARTTSVIGKRLFRTAKQILDAVFFNTSFDSYLDGWLSTFGLPDGQGGYGFILPHVSAASSGFTIETAAGMAANLTLNQQLTDSGGKTYVITEQNAPIAPGGTEDVDIESVDTGFAVNLEAGTVLTWVTPPVGADATGTLAKKMRGGTALEDNSGGQTRINSRMRRPPASGNVASFVDVIEAVSPGSLKAYVWPQRQNQPYGWNTTDYCALYLSETGTDRHIAAADDMYTDIDTAVDDGMPALTYRNSRQLTMSTISVDVEITVELGTGATEDQKCDWDAEGNKTTVANSVPGTGVITASGAVTSLTVTNGIEVGHRVVINGIEGVVTAIDGALNTTFTVGTWPDGWGSGVNPLNGYNITSGGGFIGQKTDFNNSVEGSGCVEAVRAYMDGRGPNALYNGAQSEIPGWDSSARIKELESACFVVGGGVITEVTVDDLGGGVIDLVHGAQDGATALIYDVAEITLWQVFV